jgi:hypothetical protein
LIKYLSVIYSGSTYQDNSTSLDQIDTGLGGAIAQSKSIVTAPVRDEEASEMAAWLDAQQKVDEKPADFDQFLEQRASAVANSPEKKKPGKDDMFDL